MSESNRALVLHVVNGSDPLIFAVSEQCVLDLRDEMPVLLSSGAVKAIELADGNTAAVNFGHVVSAHFDELPRSTRVYGSRPSGHGFG
jgi:hypothetical protein